MRRQFQRDLRTVFHTRTTCSQYVSLWLMMMISHHHPYEAEATLISASRVELCTNRYRNTSLASSAFTQSQSNSSSSAPPSSGGANTNENCKDKFVVSLTVDGGQQGSEQVAYWSSTHDSEGNQYALASPITIRLLKSQPLIRYPVYYARNFNAQPMERTVYTDILEGCKDNAGDAQPTCGRAFNDHGDPIPGSEGFCCRCNVCQLFGLCGNDGDRGNTRCGLLGASAAASCLVFGNLWYSGFNIGPAETWYRITVRMTIPRHVDGVTTEETVDLDLGPDQLGVVHDPTVEWGGAVSARLIGDFATFRQPKNFEGKMLFIPSVPRDHNRVRAGVAEWLVVPRDLVTFDGRECDKIGVSYEAFNRQGSRCDIPSGSCLRNQLDEIRQQDLNRIANGGLRAGEHFLSSLGDFAPFQDTTSRRFGLGNKRHSETSSARNAEDHHGDHHSLHHPAITNNTNTFTPQHWGSRSRRQQQSSRPYIAYRAGEVQASMITLQIDADNIRFSVNVANGTIISVNVTDFEATSKHGVISVTVMNVGELAADFYVTIRNCTRGTMPIPAKMIPTLAPSETHTAIFDVMSIVMDGQNRSTCNVTLQDALYVAIDTASAVFNVTPTNLTNGSQGSIATPIGGVTTPPADGGDGEGSGSCTSCPFYNPICFVLRKCFLAIIGQVLLTCFVMAAVCALLRYRGRIMSFFCPRGRHQRDSNDDDGDNDGKGNKTPRTQERNAHNNSKKRARSFTNQRQDDNIPDGYDEEEEEETENGPFASCSFGHHHYQEDDNNDYPPTLRLGRSRTSGAVNSSHKYKMSSSFGGYLNPMRSAPFRPPSPVKKPQGHHLHHSHSRHRTHTSSGGLSRHHTSSAAGGGGGGNRRTAGAEGGKKKQHHLLSHASSVALPTAISHGRYRELEYERDYDDYDDGDAVYNDEGVKGDLHHRHGHHPADEHDDSFCNPFDVTTSTPCQPHPFHNQE